MAPKSLYEDVVEVNFGDYNVRYDGTNWNVELEFRGSNLSLSSANPHILRTFLLERVGTVDSTVKECFNTISEWSSVRLWEIYTTSPLDGPFRLAGDDWLLLHGLIKYRLPQESMSAEYPEEKFYPPKLTKKGIALAYKLVSHEEDLPHKEKWASRDRRTSKIGKIVYSDNGEGVVGIPKPFVVVHWRSKVQGFYETSEKAIKQVSKGIAGDPCVLRVRDGFVFPPGVGYRISKYYRSQCMELIWSSDGSDG